MKIMHKITALVLLCATCLPLLFSCSKLNEPAKEPVELWGDSSELNELDRVSTKTAPAPTTPSYQGADTLRVGVDGTLETLSPFFAEIDAALYVNSITQLKLLPYERAGRVVTSGIDGEKFKYRGEEYEYFSIADVSLNVGGDGRATYSFQLREDVFFSDGTNLTADDAIFSMYVLLDPSYSGYSKLSSLPISGLGLYRSAMTTLYSDIFSSGREYSAQAGYSQADAKLFWDKLDSAGDKYSADIIAHTIEEYGADSYYTSEYGGKWGSAIAENDGLRCAYVMVLCGLAEWEKDEGGAFTGTLVDITGKSYDCTSIYPSTSEFWACLQSEYETLELISNSQSSKKELYEYIKESFDKDYAYFFEVKRQGMGSADNISGIKKTGMYSFDVILDKYDATAIYAFSFYVAPLHIYGDRASYKYTENKFGFTKGDLRAIEQKGLCSVGGGAYTYKSSNDGGHAFERNAYHCFGCPYIKRIEFVCDIANDNTASDIKEGRYDIAIGELTVALSGALAEEDFKSAVAYSNLNIDGYGYMGINANTVKVGLSDSEASKALRAAFCILFDVYKKDSINNYYGSRASIIDYPLSPDSWAYPEEQTTAFKKKVDGTYIYTDTMTDAERYSAALEAAREYFKLAGYEYDEKTERFVSAPEGAKLEYEFLICDGQSKDHPCYMAVRDTSDALLKLGINLRITSVPSASELELRLSRGDAHMWAYAWELSQDPDMYQVYYSKNIPSLGTGTGSNCFFITDKTLDTYIADARKSSDNERRAEIYRDCFSIVAAWGVEVPIYVKHSAFLYSIDRMSEEYKPNNLSEYYSFADEVYKIKLA